MRAKETASGEYAEKMAQYYRDVAAYREQRRAAGLPVREPLSAGQHILHLLLTVFTAGLWAPVWAWRAHQGNWVVQAPTR